MKIIEIKIAADGVSFFLRGNQGVKLFYLGNKNQYGWNPWGSGPGNGHWGGNNRFPNGNGFGGGGGGYGYGGGRGGGGRGGGYWGGPRPKRGRY